MFRGLCCLFHEADKSVRAPLFEVADRRVRASLFDEADRSVLLQISLDPLFSLYN